MFLLLLYTIGITIACNHQQAIISKRVKYILAFRRPMDLWKSAFCQYFPQDTTTNSNINKNPAVDSQYIETIIDNMRIQKDKVYHTVLTQ